VKIIQSNNYSLITYWNFNFIEFMYVHILYSRLIIECINMKVNMLTRANW